MLSPDSALTVVLIGVGGTLGIAVVARLGLRLWALAPALLSVVGLVLAGALAVNVSYGYYQTWTDAYADLSGGPVTGTAPDPTAVAHGPTGGARATAPLGQPGHGRLLTMTLGGTHGISRPAVVYLPAAYSDPAQPGRRFPVLLLLHGDPGEARGFVYGMHVDQVADRLGRAGLAQYVIVMPTVSQGWHGQQCLDDVHGPANETYLTRDVPADVQRALRVTPPGRTWAVAGLSEGGYCAADLALRHPDLFAGAGSLDGYYAPIVTRRTRRRLFGDSLELRRAATPLLTVRDWTARPAPALWLMAGDADPGDLGEARVFAAAARRVAPVRLVVVHGGVHTTPAWRTALPDLLRWAGAVVSGGAPPTGQTRLPLDA